MKSVFTKLTALVLLLAMALSLAACGDANQPTEPAQKNVAAIFQAMLTQLTYDCELTQVEENAELYFPDMPAATITMYMGDGFHADELVRITVADPADAQKAVTSAQEHLKEVRAQFLSYNPDQVAKIDAAVVWNQGSDILLCVCPDAAAAQALIDNPPQGGTAEDPTDPPTAGDDPTDPPASGEDPTDPPTEPPTEGPTEPEYHVITSKSGTYKTYNGVYLIDNMAYEGYNYSDSAAENYAKLVNKVASDLEGITNVYDLVIPTAIGVVLPDDMKDKINPEDQAARIDQIFAKMNDSVIPVNCFDRLLAHRNEYLYFRTDWHWNGPGAYYAYEEFCQVKGITPYTMEQRTERQFGNYLGGLYQQNCKKDPALAATPDTVYAYMPYCTSATMKFTDTSGKTMAWDIITDVSSWNSASKYNTFAGSDQPFAEFTNPEVTDGSVLVVVKESFGNALLSYLVDHYSKVYEIDYRYWKGDLVQFCKDRGADDLLFANNIGMIRTNLLIGKLDGIIN